MSKALYKYLQKAVLEGKEGAQDIQALMKAKARFSIIDRLARARMGETGHLLGEEIPGIGEATKKAILNAKSDLQAARDDIFYNRSLNSRSMPTQKEASELLWDWQTAPPGGRRTGPRLE